MFACTVDLSNVSEPETMYVVLICDQLWGQGGGRNGRLGLNACGASKHHMIFICFTVHSLFNVALDEFDLPALNTVIR